MGTLLLVETGVAMAEERRMRGSGDWRGSVGTYVLQIMVYQMQSCSFPVELSEDRQGLADTDLVPVCI